MLLGALGEDDVDQPTEIKERIKLGKHGAFTELVDRVTAAAPQMSEGVPKMVIGGPATRWPWERRLGRPLAQMPWVRA